VLVFLFVPSARAEFATQRVIQDGDPYPGGGAFDVVRGEVVDNGLVYFAGRPGASGQLGLYVKPLVGSSTMLVDQSIPVPGGTGNFHDVTGIGVSVSAGQLLFGNRSQNNVDSGIYLRDSGGISRIADRNTNLPNSSSKFSFFYSPVQSGSENSYFRANGTAGENGLYLSNGGSISTLVDKTTAVPGQGAATFTSFNELDAVGNLMTFSASSGSYRGIFSTSDDGQTISVVADTLTPMPNYPAWNFDVLVDAHTNGEDVIFYGRSARDPNNNNFRMEGIYGYLDDTLQMLVDLTTLNPRGGIMGDGGGFGAFNGLGDFEGDLFTFAAEHDGNANGDEDGIYLGSLRGNLALLIEEAQMFDGQIVEDVAGGDIDGFRVGFGFLSSTNVASFHVATVPEPGSFAIFAVGGAVVFSIWCRRRFH
jgi:hypothetical protein